MTSRYDAFFNADYCEESRGVKSTHLSVEKDDVEFLRTQENLYSSESPQEKALHLMAEALNVQEATGRTPRQLQDRVAALEEALRAVIEESRWGDTEECSALITAIKKAEEVLK